MKKGLSFIAALLLITSAMSGAVGSFPGPSSLRSYAQLIELFAQWRTFEASNMVSGIPSYGTVEMERRQVALRNWQARLASIDRRGWSVAQQVDYNLVRAEMNGLDFDLRVLRPWARDPAFYHMLWTEQSDTPAHEGPLIHGKIELWTYSFPLKASDDARLLAALRPVPALLAQARINLTGNTRDLWEAGIRTITEQDDAFAELQTRTATASPELRAAVVSGRRANAEFLAWLKQRLSAKNGPSGVGKANYDWYLRNVQLSPMNWETEVMLLKRELSRSHAALRLEENHHRNLPPITAADSPAAYDAQAKAAVRKYLAFLENQEILTVRSYMEPALMARTASYVPPDQQNFFQLAMHRAPMTLWTHFYHWFDLANMNLEPNPSLIRRGPLLYNIWVTRSEGQATAMEEAMLHAGLFDDQPGAREIVWIMQANRGARGLASLYAQANIFSMKQAREFQVAHTPNGWMNPHLGLLATEQQLYLRQPGYGPSYISGKYQMDKLFAEYAEKQGGAFRVRDFYDQLNKFGMIPISMIRWQMLGTDDEARAIGAK